MPVRPRDPVLSRRSIRLYKEMPVSEGHIQTLIRAGMAAPSAEDERPWHFIVLSSSALKRDIAAIHPSFFVAEKAPILIVVCGDLMLQKAQDFWVQDCAAATENMLIEAQQLELGSVWIGVYPVEGRVQGFRRLLKIPEHIIPFAVVCIGYPDETKEPLDWYDVSRVHYDAW